MEPVILGLGASLGDRVRALRMAVAALHATSGIQVLRVSRTVVSRGIGPAQGPFLNAAVLATTRFRQWLFWTAARPLSAAWDDSRRVGGGIVPSTSTSCSRRTDDPQSATRGAACGVPGATVCPSACGGGRAGLGASCEKQKFGIPGMGKGTVWRTGARRTPCRYPTGAVGRWQRRPMVAVVMEVFMKLFLDTANLDEIREAHSWGIIDGVTTNPSLIAKEGGDFVSVIAEICDIVKGPVSAETVSPDAAGMIKEGRLLAQVSEHVVVKVPLSREGLKATKALSDDGIPVNVTLCFSANQALLAAKAGATYISPFLGRLDDVGQDGVELIEQIVAIYATYPALKTEVLSASVRHPRHMVQVALAGSDVATLPFKVLSKMVDHPLTDSGNARFLKDWSTVPDPDVVGQVERFLAARKG